MSVCVGVYDIVIFCFVFGIDFVLFGLVMVLGVGMFL